MDSKLITVILALALCLFLMALVFAPHFLNKKSASVDSLERLREMLGDHCLVCETAQSPHRIASIACTSSIEPLAKAIEAQDWKTLSEIVGVDPSADIYMVTMIECADHRLAWYLVKDPFELYEDHDLVCWHDINQQSATVFREVYAQKDIEWREFSTSKDTSWYGKHKLLDSQEISDLKNDR